MILILALPALPALRLQKSLDCQVRLEILGRPGSPESPRSQKSQGHQERQGCQTNQSHLGQKFPQPVA